MLRAGRLLQGLAGSNNGTVIKVESGHALHVSFNYFCCYDPIRVDAIRDVLNTTTWPPLNISFQAPVVRVDNTIVPGAKSDTSHHFSVIVLLDEASNARMEAWVADVERALQRTATSTSFWTVFRAVLSSTPTPHAPCAMLNGVPIRIGC